jgi:hypothetical protein
MSNKPKDGPIHVMHVSQLWGKHAHFTNEGMFLCEHRGYLFSILFCLCIRAVE